MIIKKTVQLIIDVNADKQWDEDQIREQLEVSFAEFCDLISEHLDAGPIIEREDQSIRYFLDSVKPIE